MRMEGDEAVKASEVVGWFVESGIKSRPIPKEEHVKDIVDTVNLCRIITDLPSTQKSRLLRQAFTTMLEARSPLAKARQLIASSIAICDSIDDPDAPQLLWEARELLRVLEAFLERHPPQGSGRPDGQSWTLFARPFANRVVDTLVRSGWPSASTTNDAGAVAFVTSRILDAADLGKVKPETVARYLRSPEGKSMSREKRQQVITEWAKTPDSLPPGARRGR